MDASGNYLRQSHNLFRLNTASYSVTNHAGVIVPPPEKDREYRNVNPIDCPLVDVSHSFIANVAN